MLVKIRKSLKNQKGFTLVELMAVIAILGILAAVAIPKFSNATAAANTGKVAADLATMDEAVQMYTLASGGVAPTTINNLVAGVNGSGGFLTAAPTAPVNGQSIYIANATNATGALCTLTTAAAYNLAVVNGITRVYISGTGLTANATGYITAEYVHQTPP